MEYIQPNVCRHAISIVDDLYQSNVMRMNRKHKACIEWALSIGVVTKANKKALFVTLVDHIPRLEAH